MSLQLELKPLTGSRAGHKRWVTRTLNDLQAAKDAGNLDACLFQEARVDLIDYISKIMDVETKIRELYDKHNISLEDAERKAATDATAKFH